MHSARISSLFLKISFIVGPLLLLIGSFLFVLGFGISPNNKSSYIEGIFGCYGIALFIPIYWELGRKLGESKKTFAAITYITGLLGTATGFTHMYGRIFEYELRQHGVTEHIWQSFYNNPGGELMSVALLGILFPLTSILLGIGLLITRKIAWWMSIGLIVAGILFPAAMITQSDALLHTAYPLACIIWVVVGASYGFTYLCSARLKG